MNRPGLECGGLVAGTGVLAAGHGVGGVKVTAVAGLDLKLGDIDDLSVAALEDVDVRRENREHGGVGGGEVVEPRLADDRVAVLRR